MQTQQFIALIVGTAVLVAGGNAWSRDGADRRPVFEEIDSNTDGALSKAEMQAARVARMARIDTDGDGLLSLQELIAMDQERSAQRVERMLGHLDANKDGKLSQAEMDQRRGQRRVFERMDADGDGSVSRAEFDEARANLRDRRRGFRDN